MTLSSVNWIKDRFLDFINILVQDKWKLLSVYLVTFAVIDSSPAVIMSIFIFWFIYLGLATLYFVVVDPQIKYAVSIGAILLVLSILFVQGGTMTEATVLAIGVLGFLFFIATHHQSQPPIINSLALHFLPKVESYTAFNQDRGLSTLEKLRLAAEFEDLTSITVSQLVNKYEVVTYIKGENSSILVPIEGGDIAKRFANLDTLSGTCYICSSDGSPLYKYTQDEAKPTHKLYMCDSCRGNILRTLIAEGIVDEKDVILREI